MRNPLFAYFDWLCDKGWLTANGTFKDYMVVAASTLPFSIPVILLYFYLMGVL